MTVHTKKRSTGCPEHHLDRWYIYSRQRGISCPRVSGVSPGRQVCLSLRRDSESSACPRHSLTSVSLCLGASLSSHLASLILVCLEGDGWWKWVGALRFKYWWSLAGEIRQMRLIDGERGQKVAGDIFSGGIWSIGLQMTQNPRQWLL